MRDIKFRSWLTLENEMLNKFGIVYNNEPSETSRRVLMQYTGLKDKNGVEIFEGDIVKGYYDEWDQYFAENNRHQFISDVKYIDNSFKVHRNTVNDEGRIRDYGYQHVWDSENVEVIGNIYEHPELLGDTN